MTNDPTGIPTQPVVRPPFIPLVLDADTIQFCIGPWAGPQYTIHDADSDGTLTHLLDYLDGDHTKAEITAAFDSSATTEIIDILEQLYHEGVLIDGSELESDLLGGYLTRPDTTISDRLPPVDQATIAVISDGVVGHTVALDLATTGLENILLYEQDPLHIFDSLASQVIEHPAITDASTRPLENAIRQATCVVYTASSPRPDQIATVNQLTLDQQIPWISGQLHGLDGLLGPAILPGYTGCYECFQHRASGTISTDLGYREVEQQRSQYHQPPPIPAFGRVLAGYLTLDTLHLLHGQTAFLLGRVVRFDFFTFTISANSILRAPRCGTCAGADQRTLGRQQLLSFEQLIRETES